MSLFDELMANPSFFDHRDDPKVQSFADLFKRLAASGQKAHTIDLQDIKYDGEKWRIEGVKYNTSMSYNFTDFAEMEAQLLRDSIVHYMGQRNGWGGTEDLTLRQFNSVNRFFLDLVHALKVAYVCESVFSTQFPRFLN